LIREKTKNKTPSTQSKNIKVIRKASSRKIKGFYLKVESVDLFLVVPQETPKMSTRSRGNINIQNESDSESESSTQIMGKMSTRSTQKKENGENNQKVYCP